MTSDELDAQPRPPGHESFTVVVRGVPFPLSRHQCECDSPNFFTSAFFSGFKESQSRTVYTDRSPTLFSIILNYLSGYDILPLPPVADMDPAAALRNLYKDAVYFDLSKLEELITERLKPVFLSPPSAALEAYGFGPRVTLQDLRSGAVQLERDASKLRLTNNYVPLKGETLPPLVLAQDILCHINWSTWPSLGSDLTTLIGNTHQFDIPPSPPPCAPLHCTGFAFHLDLQSGIIEEGEEDASLSLDGIDTSFAHLSNLMGDSIRQVVVGGSDTTPTTPLGKVLVEHLETSKAELPPQAFYSGPMEDDFTVGVPYYAEELWLVPVFSEVGSDEVLDSFTLRLVAAKLHTKRTGTLRLLEPPRVRTDHEF